MKKLFSAVLFGLLINLYCPVWAVVVKSGTSIYLNPTETISSKDEPSVLKANVIDDVIVGGKTVIKAGANAQIKVADVEKAGAWGNPGYINLGNGYVIDANGDKQRVELNQRYSGKDKEWVKVTCCLGLFLWPLLLFGFVKGNNAKITSAMELEVITVNDFTY